MYVAAAYKTVTKGMGFAFLSLSFITSLTLDNLANPVCFVICKVGIPDTITALK